MKIENLEEEINNIKKRNKKVELYKKSGFAILFFSPI